MSESGRGRPILTTPGGNAEPHPDVGYALICFYTEQPERLGRFYEEVLGFRAKRDHPHQLDRSHSTWLDAGAITILIHAAERYMRPPFDPATDSTLVWFNCADEASEVVERCRAHGIEVYDHNGNLVVIRDIEGRRIGLTCLRSVDDQWGPDDATPDS